MSSNSLKILFITRKYPPSVGGMQRLSYDFVSNMQKIAEVFAVTWGRSQLFLPIFLIYSLVIGLYLARKVDILYAGDPVVGPIVWFLSRLYRRPAVVCIHGLDITFNFALYQIMIKKLLRKFDRIVCISKATCLRALERGIEPERCFLIHPGVNVPDEVPDRDQARKCIELFLGESLSDKQVWITVGRLIKRKGVTWFCENVLPYLNNRNGFIYLVIGSGPELSNLRNIVHRYGLDSCVRIIGYIDDDYLRYFYSGSDIFIMPNIYDPYNPEGFGLVLIEASAYGLPVVAARVDGIPEAVIEGETGYLLPSGDAKAWINFLQECLNNPVLLDRIRIRARYVVNSRFNWQKIINNYLDLFNELLSK